MRVRQRTYAGSLVHQACLSDEFSVGAALASAPDRRPTPADGPVGGCDTPDMAGAWRTAGGKLGGAKTLPFRCHKTDRSACAGEACRPRGERAVVRQRASITFDSSLAKLLHEQQQAMTARVAHQRRVAIAVHRHDAGGLRCDEDGNVWSSAGDGGDVDIVTDVQGRSAMYCATASISLSESCAEIPRIIALGLLRRLSARNARSCAWR